MALINTFTKQETGTEFANAYHRVIHPTVNEAGPGVARSLTFYLASYSSKANRDAGLGAEYTAKFNVPDYDLSNPYEFAYTFLKTLDQLQDAVDV